MIDYEIDTNEVRAWAYGLVRWPDCLGDPEQPAALALADAIDELTDENARLESFITALAEHATTTWPDSSCGRDRPAGQVVTTTAHVAAVTMLLRGCGAGWTLTETADAYAAEWPGSTRLDGPAGKSSRGGPDGRPLAKESGA